MYTVISYHGIGKREVANDLRLLWDNFNNFARHRKIRHIYCFQTIDDKKGADVLLVIQYENPGMFKTESETPLRYVRDSILNNSGMHERIDYWFYVRE